MGFLDSIFGSSRDKIGGKATGKIPAGAAAGKASAAPERFIRQTERQASAAPQDALIKKGSALLQQGDPAAAHKIFSALKNYDGLMKTSALYYKRGDAALAHAAAREAGSFRPPSRNTPQAVATALGAWLGSGSSSGGRGAAVEYAPPERDNIQKILLLYGAGKRRGT